MNRTRWRLPLGAKLGCALLLAAVLLAILVFQFGAAVESRFLERTQSLLASSRVAMQRTAEERIRESGELLVELIAHTADDRRRLLADLPLSLYDGDDERIRSAIANVDRQRTDRLLRNVGILAREMERRAERGIEADLQRLGEEQATLGHEFAAAARRSASWLSGALLGGLMGLLGLGLYRAVVHPLRQLRRATQSITRGELDAKVKVHSHDEVGDLATDFARMLEQLRDSRQEIASKNAQLEQWNKRLESEVERKTEHLERTLHDLRRTQRQLLHSAKMAALGTLSRGVAHEYNNLIGGIRGCTTELLESETDGERRALLEVVGRAADRGAEITRQLLHFSRERMDRMEIADVATPLRDALRLIEPEARRRGVRIERRIPEALAAPCDAGALHQVFLNLFTNALQAMPDGGTLSVEASGRGEEIVVRVRDSGHGIPATEIDHVFDPFFTTKDQAEDPASRGSGLGLSVSYGILEAHGGSIQAESEEGRGATFTVRLPHAPANES